MQENPALDQMEFNRQLVNEGNDVYLYQQSATAAGVSNFVLNINVPQYLGIDINDRYNWRYFAFGGISGFSTSTQYNSHLRSGVTVLPNWDPPSPDTSNTNDTSINYGRFRVAMNFSYTGDDGNRDMFNANFNLLFNAKKFKGFES